MKLLLESSDEEHQAFADAWSLQLGRFMSSFAGIENVMYNLLESASDANVVDAVRGAGLDLRRKLIVALAKQRTTDQQVLAMLETFLQRVMAMSKPRNVVAHNGQVLLIYDETDGLELRPVVHRANHPADAIDIAGLQKLAEEALQLRDYGWLVEGDFKRAVQANRKVPPG